MLEFLEESEEENLTKEPQSNSPKKRKLVASFFLILQNQKTKEELVQKIL